MYANGEYPYELEYAHGDFDDLVPSWPVVIDDCVSRAKFALRTQGAVQALSTYGRELKQMAATTHWRAPEAAILLIKIQRQMLAEVKLCEAQLSSTPA